MTVLEGGALEIAYEVEVPAKKGTRFLFGGLAGAATRGTPKTETRFETFHVTGPIAVSKSAIMDADHKRIQGGDMALANLSAQEYASMLSRITGLDYRVLQGNTLQYVNQQIGEVEGFRVVLSLAGKRG